ncbi:MAG: alpha/beta hydrolase [Pseudomonadales bacterium]|nr:alpha/beta hydrolase [Pseudomonadales bacterium]
MPFTKLDGYEIHYTLCGPEQPEKRIMYVHGTGCNSAVWHRHCDSMSNSHQCVAIDLPGHGQSEGSGFRGTADYAHFVQALAETLGWDRYILVGHSLGGAIALTVAVYHPGNLSGLILVDTGARLRVEPEILDAARRAAKGEVMPRSDPRWTYAVNTPDSVIEAVRADLGDVSSDIIYRDWVADDTFDFLHRVKSIETPAIAICGDEDPITPVRNHVYFHTQMPRCELEVIRECGHWPAYEKPGLFDSIVERFVNQL